MPNPTELPEIPMTPDHADLEFLSKIASERDSMIMIPAITLQPSQLQQALYRALVGDWIKLVDIVMEQAPVPMTGLFPYRIFKITDEGRARLAQLRVSVTI